MFEMFAEEFVVIVLWQQAGQYNLFFHNQNHKVWRILAFWKRDDHSSRLFVSGQKFNPLRRSSSLVSYYQSIIVKQLQLSLPVREGEL